MADLWDDIREDDFGGDDAMGALIAVVGLDVAKRIVEAFGGGTIYIPKAESVIRAARDRRIFAEFTGCNHRELADRYNLTERRVRHIADAGRTSGRRSARIDDRQMEMF